MATPSIREEYKKWLASNEGNFISVNTIEITQGDPANFTFYLCDYGQDFSAKDEDGNSLTFTAVPMKFGVESRKNTTEQRLVVTLDALEGQVYAQLKAITDSERSDPINVTYRQYQDNDLSGPAIDPPSEFILVGASCDVGRVTLELTTTTAPQKRCGQYATVRLFSALKYL